jgi:hypothetical protein
MTEIPTQPKEPTITEEIMEMLEQNGSIDRSVKDRLMLKAIGEILRKIDQLKSLNDRIERLEKRNIATLFLEHPIQVSVTVFIIFIVFNLIAHSVSVWAVTSAILQWLGFPTPTT